VDILIQGRKFPGRVLEVELATNSTVFGTQHQEYLFYQLLLYIKNYAAYCQVLITCPEVS
jgi:hypothetical protein